jgi:hypothetical protein
MKIALILFCMSLFFKEVEASQHQHMNSLGTSQAGQFIALEEYGYKKQGHVYYSNIRFINVWTGDDVGTVINHELPALNKDKLQHVRQKAKDEAREQMAKYKIISS